jgi:hypothetical protein
MTARASAQIDDSWVSPTYEDGSWSSAAAPFSSGMLGPGLTSTTPVNAQVRALRVRIASRVIATAMQSGDGYFRTTLILANQDYVSVQEVRAVASLRARR